VIGEPGHISPAKGILHIGVS